MIVPLFPLKEFIPMPLFTTYVKEGQRTNNGRLEVYSSVVYVASSFKIEIGPFFIKIFFLENKMWQVFEYVLPTYLPTYIYTAM